MQVKDGEVTVRSPHFLPNFVINRFVREKEAWINKLIIEQQGQAKLAPNEIYHLGQRKQIEFAGDDRIGDETISLKAIGTTKLEKKKVLQKFLEQETRKYVHKFLDKHKGFQYEGLKFSHYLSKWGSCSGTNDLTFNIKLAMCPENVIEYVVVHELCHTLVKNHSSDFWFEVERILPDYKKRRKWLRDNRWHL